ncbi:hypothetical protein P5673_029238 [Acropora cervicornis]|uniref:Uncharacterized protein n=1 Tax=Acropora cervicornis TaxID=6130 RepID=A0AAD9PW68_ACRCE|nr:hypothetical protein P5673_029238 [Acropora cervicornis]
MVECSAGGMSAAGSEVMNVTQGMTKIRVRPDSLSCESQKAILAFSSFVRTKKHIHESFLISRCERVNLKIDHVLWNECKHGRILEVSR